MKYYFKTPFGIFFISTAPYGGYNLIMNDDVINWADTAQELASQVQEKTSGFQEWDLSQNEAPKEIEDWQVRI